MIMETVNILKTFYRT